jgi:hypothetical protein
MRFHLRVALFLPAGVIQNRKIGLIYFRAVTHPKAHFHGGLFDGG